MRVLLGITGSVAATQTPKLIGHLIERCCTDHDNLQIIATKQSFRFWDPDRMFVRPNIRIWRDGDEWPSPRYERGQAIPHIDLATWVVRATGRGEHPCAR